MPPIDADTFQQLALEHLDTLHRLARRLTRDVQLAEDIVQETYLRAFKSRHTFDLKDFGIRPWLIRILNNTFLTRGKRESRQPKGVEHQYLESVADGSADDIAFDFEQVDERLAAAVQELPDEYRMPLLLWGVEDLSYKEIAQALDVPMGTVMSRLHRARQKLMAELKPLADERRIGGD